MPSQLAAGIPQIQRKARFSDFAPDSDSITPGVLLDCSNVFPTAKGFRSYPSLVRYSSNALPSACLGAYAGQQGANFVVAAGTASELYLLTGQAWVAQSTGATPITGRWRFDLYGNDLIAVNGVDRAFVYTGSGTFSALGGTPPVASIVQATDYALFLIAPNSSTWWASLSDTIWTPAISTATVTGGITSSRGNITAAKAIRTGIVIYKRNALHLGQYAGPPFFWDFGDKVSSEVGAPSQEAVANLGEIHLFPGPDDFYTFDAFGLKRIPNQLKEWFFENLDQTNDHKIAARWDQKRSLVFWHFPSVEASPAGTLDMWICYNLRTGKWSKGAEEVDMPVFSAIQTGQLTYSTFKATYATYGAVSGVYGDLMSRTTDISGAVKKGDHALHLYNGAPDQAYFTPHDFGDRRNMYQVTEISPQWEKRPTSATLQVLEQKNNPGETPTDGPTATMNADGKFHCVNTARLQRFKITVDDEMETTGIEADAEFAGER